MSFSLDTLVRGLPSDELHYIRQAFPDPNQFQLCIRKGVFPYDYVSSWLRLDERQLPAKSAFSSILNSSTIPSLDGSSSSHTCDISDEEYHHACHVWNTFGIQSLGDYADLYLKVDTLLLTDVFEKFRAMCLSIYGLDPCHYYTSPGLSWDAMLKITGVELDLLTDVDMLLFFERGIRGGLVSLVNRHAVANHPYLEHYDPSKCETYLMYYDVNNLYGYAMSQPLPYKDFAWLSKREMERFDVHAAAKESNRGYVLEVDLAYPSRLHDAHSDLPFCVERMIPPHSESKHKKLLATLHPKQRYVIHIQSLMQCLGNGLQLVHIHRIVRFTQTAWLKPYMDLNTEHRQRATTTFEVNFFKLMNNCIYGKSMENVRKHRDIRLVNQWDGRYGARQYIAKPNFHSYKVIDRDLLTVEMSRLELVYNKPIYLGMVILDYSKQKMYDFHYGFAKPNFGDVSLLYMDTDSFIYSIRDTNVYDVMRRHSHYFDTSSYSPGNDFNIQPGNKKVIGLMKDECASDCMTEFIGLAPKMYAYQTVNSRSVCKAKGVRTSVIRHFRLDHYRKVLLDRKDALCTQRRIMSSAHEVRTVEQVKRSLIINDDKRHWSPNGLSSLPWGYESNST